MFRAGLIQLSVTDDPVANLPVTIGLVREAAAKGADFILTYLAAEVAERLNG